MLTPEYLWSAADVVVNTYDEMNNWAIRDMAERIMAAELYGDKLPGTARYRAWMLNQSGMHYEEMSKKLAEVTKKAEPDIMKLFIEAGLTSVANDYAPFGMEPYDITKDKVATQILESVYKKTKGELHNYTRTTLDQSNKLFVDVLDKAFYEVSTGMRSYNEVIQEAIETVSKEGCTVKYPSGHVDKQEVAVRRGLMTGVNQAAAELCLHNCEVLGTDYVIVDAHEGARYSETDKIANHLGWQGGVYKIHGVGTYSNEKKDIISKIIKFLHKIGIHVKNDTIPNLEEETGYPSNPLGLCGYNCRHCISPFLPQYEKAEYKNIKVDQEKSKREYDLMQKQRAKERSIRDTRRELIGLDAAIENCKDEETKFNLQMNYDKIAKKLERQTDAYNKFCDENNLTRDYNRMQTAKFDRDQAYKATRGAKRYDAVDVQEHKVQHVKGDNRNIVNTRVVNSKNYTEKFDGVGSNKKVDNIIKNRTLDILDERNGTNLESVSYMDIRTGKEIVYNNTTDLEFGVKLTEDEKRYISNYDGNLIAIHNHPQSSRPSYGDIITMQDQKNVEKIIVAAHNGKVYIISNIDRTVNLETMYEKEITFYKKNGFDIALAKKKALDAIYEKGVFEYEER